ncbi:hypothetical protein SAMN04489806_1162 [Paramicrobacterium humi]|uniref:Uncharacterized protein n=1 Tax=Paramicrobacterium humi TaxID=640635 RepID=A0A1H4KGM9_9MICO|nr:hypothetical protein [Microbacterium humi]SEB57680.1 hypothetical protein SAMN04489806_1162 [Microbacterium humi]
MYESPELYYDTVWRERERELEQRIAWRRAAEESPERVVPSRLSLLRERAVTALRGVFRARRERAARTREAASSPEPCPTALP